MSTAFGDHPLGLGKIHGHRFLAEHMLTGTQRGDRGARMQRHRQRNVNGVDG